jgi:phosphoribosylformylglycinamidine cyclo-ligase
MSKQYEQSGVSLERGYNMVRSIKTMIPQTNNRGVMGNIGDFGGLFDLSKYNIKEPILVSGTDGVGTKLLLAQEANKHDTIGIDLVAMCVNDIITIGAQPLYFLDYIATGVIEEEVLSSVVSGIVEGCKLAGAALIGGETAEMPDMYQSGHYDLAGYTTGVVEKSKMINKNNVKEGDVLIGLPSSGLHSNGYSLVRKIFFKDNNYQLDQYIDELQTTLQESLLEPTTIYVKPVLHTLNSNHIHAISHITGGGFYENIPRAIPDHLGVKIDTSSWPKPQIFDLIEQVGKIDSDEMYHVFNMGIGMVFICDKNELELTLASLEEVGSKGYQIGTVTAQKGVVLL